MKIPLSSGQGLTLIPQDAEVTVAQVAKVLHVSHPFLIKVLEDGHIPHRKVDKHRRVRVEDVINYKRAID